MLLIAVERADCSLVERTGVAGNGLSGGVSKGKGEETDRGEQLVLAEVECVMAKERMDLFEKCWSLYTIPDPI